jgi:apolipoprotein N-acyltransferase
LLSLLRNYQYRQWAVAAALGATTVLGYAPTAYTLIPIITFGGLFALWQHATTARAAALIGGCFGLAWFGVGVSWIYISLHDFGGTPATGALLLNAAFCSYLALFPALAGYCVKRFQQAHISYWLLVAPALCTISEWLRGVLFTGFPWLHPGYSQTASPLAGYAAVLGIHGINFLLFTSAGLCALLYQSLRSRTTTPKLWASTVIVGALWAGGYGLNQIAWTSASPQPLTVSVLQGNVSQDQKWHPTALRETLLTYLDMVRQSHNQLIVLPETALPLFLQDVPSDYLEAMAHHARAQGGAVLLGVPERGRSGEYYNSVLALDGHTSQFYRKSHLVPFGEFIPLRALIASLVSQIAIPLQDFSPGSITQQPLTLGNERIAINICYEDAFGDEIIRQLPLATVLVNVSNVAWFGHSHAAQQHLQIAQMRARETGRFMLRATNTGMTAIINPYGQVLAAAPEFSRTSVDYTVTGMHGSTPYIHWGNHCILWLCGLILGGTTILRYRARPTANH